MARGFQEVTEAQETAQVVEHPAASTHERNIAAQALTLLLKGLSQKALVAISSLFTAAALFSAWWLWSDVLADPTALKLVGVGGYAGFILALEIVRRK